MKSPEVDAHLHVRNFTFNQAYLGEMNLHGGWEKEKNAIFLHGRPGPQKHDQCRRRHPNRRCPQGRPRPDDSYRKHRPGFSEPLHRRHIHRLARTSFGMDPRIRPVQRYQSGRRHASQRRRNESQRNRSGLPPRQRFRHPAPGQHLFP